MDKPENPAASLQTRLRAAAKLPHTPAHYVPRTLLDEAADRIDALLTERAK